MKRKNLQKKRWLYDFNCNKCCNLKFINDSITNRNGLYCIKQIDLLDNNQSNCIHADNDFVVRCDFYQQIFID